MTQILGHNFIGGQRSAEGSVIVKSVDASTGETLVHDFHQATLGEVDRAARAAASAYPAFRALSAERRAEFLEAIADELDALGDEFVAIVCRETALPAGRIQGERGRTSGQMRLFAKVLRRGDFYGARIDQALPDRAPLPRPDLRQYRIGLGPVAVFGASNFPLAFSTAGGDTASALAARSATIARELAASVVQGCGQFCTNPGLVIGIRSAAFSAFIEQLAGQINEQSAQTMLNAGTLRSYVKGLDKLLAHKGIEHVAGAAQQGNQARPQLFKADVSLLLEGDEVLQEEVFGPTTVVIEVADQAQLSAALNGLHGQLTATLIGEMADFEQFSELTPLLEQKVGRILLNGYPTGVEVCDSMVHGGPYPATSDARGTSVGTLAIDRFLRPVCFQNYPDSLLPDALKNANPLGLQRLIDGQLSDRTLG